MEEITALIRSLVLYSHREAQLLQTIQHLTTQVETLTAELRTANDTDEESDRHREA